MFDRTLTDREKAEIKISIVQRINDKCIFTIHFTTDFGIDIIADKKFMTDFLNNLRERKKEDQTRTTSPPNFQIFGSGKLMHEGPHGKSSFRWITNFDSVELAMYDRYCYERLFIDNSGIPFLGNTVINNIDQNVTNEKKTKMRENYNNVHNTMNDFITKNIKYNEAFILKDKIDALWNTLNDNTEFDKHIGRKTASQITQEDKTKYAESTKKKREKFYSDLIELFNDKLNKNQNIILDYNPYSLYSIFPRSDTNIFSYGVNNKTEVIKNILDFEKAMKEDLLYEEIKSNLNHLIHIKFQYFDFLTYGSINPTYFSKNHKTKFTIRDGVGNEYYSHCKLVRKNNTFADVFFSTQTEIMLKNILLCESYETSLDFLPSLDTILKKYKILLEKVYDQVILTRSANLDLYKIIDVWMWNNRIHHIFHEFIKVGGTVTTLVLSSILQRKGVMLPFDKNHISKAYNTVFESYFRYDRYYNSNTNLCIMHLTSFYYYLESMMKPTNSNNKISKTTDEVYTILQALTRKIEQKPTEGSPLKYLHQNYIFVARPEHMFVVKENKILCDLFKPEVLFDSLIKAYIQGSGPLMIKLIQNIVERENVQDITDETYKFKYDYNLNDVFENMPYVLESERTTLYNKIGVDTKDFTETSSASIAQVDISEDIVMKFVKKRSISQLYEEELFLEIVNNTQLNDAHHDFIRHIIDAQRQGMDLSKEKENIIIAREVYSKSYGNTTINTVELHQHQFNSSDIIFMKKAPGKSLKTYIDAIDAIDAIDRMKDKLDSLTLLYKGFIKLTWKWIETALFTTKCINGVKIDGFAHLDLHPGNIFVEKIDSQKNITFTLIDFGDCCIFKKEETDKIKKLMSLFRTSKNDNEFKIKLINKVVDHLNIICNTQSSIKEGNPIIKDFLEKNKDLPLPLGGTIVHVLQAMGEIGKCSNNFLINFGRGFKLLEDTWKTIIEKYNNNNQDNKITKSLIQFIFCEIPLLEKLFLMASFLK